MLNRGTNGLLTIDEIRERLSPLFQPVQTGGECLRLALLFGSYAAGNPRKGSDIDLAFLYDKPLDILDMTNKVVRLLQLDNVDVVDLRRASPLLRFSAIQKGVLIYQRAEGTFNEYCSLAFRMYADTKKLRDAQKEGINLFLSQRGLA